MNFTYVSVRLCILAFNKKEPKGDGARERHFTYFGARANSPVRFHILLKYLVNTCLPAPALGFKELHNVTGKAECS